MIIGGLEKLSLIDFPGHIAAVIFTKACNFRCHFCYNPMLVLAEGEGENQYKEEDFSLVSEEDLFLFLESRLGKIDGVVVSGGEPTLHRDLPEFIAKIKQMGLAVKLDSNGTNPQMIKELLDKNLIDYIAMDYKAPLERYEEVVSALVDLEKIKESVELLKEERVPYEFRTTLVPGLHSIKDIEKMSEELLGAKKWFLQKFKSDTELVNNDFKDKSSFSSQEMRQMLELAQKKVPNCHLRD